MLPLACMPTITGTIEARRRLAWTTPVRYWTVQSRSGQNRIGCRERSAPSCQGFGRYSAWKASCSDLFVVGQPPKGTRRSEEHTSELQSLRHLVCRLLLEKKKHKTITDADPHLVHAGITRRLAASRP